MIIDELGHVFNYESGAAAHLSSVQLRPLKGKRGKLEPHQVEYAVRTRNDWDPFSKVLAIENTTNKGGGAYYSNDELLALRGVADKYGLSVHLDGARIWNAMVESGIEASFFGTIADTISVCFSKGLGAPVGSMMLATGKHIKKARRIRKMWGGGMRQIGLLASAADYAVDHHFELLKKDHERAKTFARAVAENDAFIIDLDTVDTNIVLFDVADGDAETVLNYFTENGVGMVPFGPKTIRTTFHFQITDEEAGQVVELVRKYQA